MSIFIGWKSAYQWNSFFLMDTESKNKYKAHL